MKNFGTLFCSILLLIGCGKQKQSNEDTDNLKSLLAKSIIRHSDLVKVDSNWGEAPVSVLDSIGRMKLGCTVTHIGNNIGLTAGHCFAGSSWFGPAFYNFVRGVSCNHFSGKSSAEYTVTFGVRNDNLDGNTEGRCQGILAAEFNEQRDYAFISLDNVPHVALSLDLKSDAPVGREISIYSHPKKRALEWSRNCQILDKEKSRIQYDCDTEPGSSGAALLDAARFSVVGVHNSGTHDRWSGHNSGTSMKDIWDKITIEFN